MKLIVRARARQAKGASLIRRLRELALRRTQLRRSDPDHPALASGLPGTSMLRSAFEGSEEAGETLGAPAAFTEI